MTTFQQPWRLNIHASPDEIWTRRDSLQLCIAALPLLALTLVLAAESTCLNITNPAGEPLSTILLAGIVGMTLVCAVMLPLGGWMRNHIKRVLVLKKKHVQMLAGEKGRLVRWKNVLAFHFEPARPRVVEPAAHIDEWCRVTIEFKIYSHQGRWSMILTDAHQKQSLLEELQSRLREGAVFTIVQHATPLPDRPKRKPMPLFMNFTAYFIGMWFLCHGIFFFGLAILPPLPNIDPSIVDPAIVQFLAVLRGNHDPRHFLIVLGAALLVIGLIIRVPAALWVKRERARYLSTPVAAV